MTRVPHWIDERETLLEELERELEWRRDEDERFDDRHRSYAPEDDSE